MSAAAIFLHQPGGFQDLQVLRDSGTANRKTVGQFANAQCAFTQQVQQGLAGGIGEGGEDRLMVSHDLR